MKPFYEENGITIYNGDSREIIPILDKADLVLTDPPYGLGESNKRAISRANIARPIDYGDFNWDNAPADKELLTLAISKAKNSIIWGGNYFQVPPSSCWLIWDKQNGASDFADCELAWTNLDRAVRIFRFLWNGMLRAGEQRGVPRVHPTQKPVELMRWCLNFAPDAQTIIDPFMGSGTTLRAAKDLGRKAIGIEIEEKYCEIAAKRLSQEVFDFSPVAQRFWVSTKGAGLNF